MLKQIYVNVMWLKTNKIIKEQQINVFKTIGSTEEIILKNV
uniref:Uncharacterized protein n=1 Tax=Meloidogyne enterolobii TaxID=390850 RepID=A0A6V7VMZ3_MELEN|nr:unnamed protein product [Meloidogyne enterolobii]